MNKKTIGQKIYEILAQLPEGEIEISALSDQLNLSRELLSSHLRVMEAFGDIKITDRKTVRLTGR